MRHIILIGGRGVVVRPALIDLPDGGELWGWKIETTLGGLVFEFISNAKLEDGICLALDVDRDDDVYGYVDVYDPEAWARKYRAALFVE